MRASSSVFRGAGGGLGAGSPGAAPGEQTFSSKLKDEKGCGAEQAGGQGLPSPPHLGQAEAAPCLLSPSGFPDGRPGKSERHFTVSSPERGTGI